MFVTDLNNVCNKEFKCLMSISYNFWTWNRKLGHTNFELIDEIRKGELVDSFLKLSS